MRLIILAAFAASALAARASTIGDLHVIPVAAHAPGAGGELWRTDVTLLNVAGQTIAVDLAVATTGGEVVPAQTAVTVPPHGSVTIRDALADRAAAGALLLSGTGPFAVTSRTYVERNGGTIGQSIGPASEFLDAVHPDAFLAGLVSNGRFRTNLGFFAAAGPEPFSVQIALLDASGTSLGSRRFDVTANQVMWTQLNVSDIAPATSGVAAARVTLLGDGVATAYASVVDNLTSAGAFVTAAVSGDGHGAARTRLRYLLRHSTE
jgi:hypothetical protein